ncbi:MAG: glycosyltransferase [Castellaniella sp.]|nr:glycosyltransferase [Castellaniella sp.]
MSNADEKPILFVTTTLGTGGAERMLLKILKRMDRARYRPTVVSLLDEGSVGVEIAALGVPIVCLHMNKSWRIFIAPFILSRLVRRTECVLVQGWMYHGNLLAWIGRLFSGRKVPLSFGIRQSLYGLARERLNTRWVIRANAWMSGRVQGFLFNSRYSLQSHRDFGFRGRNMRVIPNGFDLDLYLPKSERSLDLRRGLGLGSELVVGMVARFHPVKGHHDFLRAAAIVHRSMPGTVFLLIGTGVTQENKKLADWIDGLGLTRSVRLLGERTDVADLNNIFDIACLASLAEAFPNVIGESMSCGVPCVVTDVGDCAEIVGETGRVVKAGDSESLAAAMLELLGMDSAERRRLGQAARARVIEQYDMQYVVQQYEKYFESLLADRQLGWGLVQE